MAKANVFVWHKANGQIVAIGRAMSEKHAAVPVAGEGQFVLETQVEESHIEKLHRTHLVDLNKRALVKHPSKK